jgi:PhoD related phosphatase
MAEAPVINGYGEGPQIDHSAPHWQVICGPLLNFKGTRPGNLWSGTVLIVAKPNQQEPVLYYQCLGSLESGTGASSQSQSSNGVKLFETPEVTFWRFQLSVPLQQFEAKWEYTIPGIQLTRESKATKPESREFVVPAVSQSMRIMFHSCNGFSVGTDIDAWNGPALWNDVMRVHAEKPFHVMIGGGDQIYNDGIRVEGNALHEWTTIANPRKRRDYPFPDALRANCDAYYLDNYLTWYSTESFASANSQIAQINIWDDHDIIDGFGSYTDHFMKGAVFRGIGGVAHKYYCLFQHHIAPPKSTYTTDAPQTMQDQDGTGAGADPRQLENTFVYEEKEVDPSFIVGLKPGPYVEEKSRNLYMRLGAHIAFVGIDARTERTRHQINYPETYDLIFQRLESEINSAGPGQLKHLIVLLGVPIAYPRLAWLENILSSPIIGPIRFLNRRFGIAGGLFNKFDGGVDLLDDLDDHYCARQHKGERKELIERLQALSQAHNIRISILGGDVHLGAIGRFYSKTKLGIEPENDPRYIVNIISSAITNKPPPQAIANLLAKRNKIHHLDHECDETLMKFFDKDPGNVPKNAKSNQVTMPSRNYAIITESAETAAENGTTNGAATNGAANHAHDPTTNGHDAEGVQDITPTPKAKKVKDGHAALGKGEEGAGIHHLAADGVSSVGIAGALNVCLKVEVDPHDPQGRTEGYGFYSKFFNSSR